MQYFEIVSHFPAKDLGRASSVCKEWKQLCERDMIWMALVKQQTFLTENVSNISFMPVALWYALPP